MRVRMQRLCVEISRTGVVSSLIVIGVCLLELTCQQLQQCDHTKADGPQYPCNAHIPNGAAETAFLKFRDAAQMLRNNVEGGDEILALHLRPRLCPKLALVWFVLALLLSIASGVITALLTHQVDVGLGVGSTTMGVLAALQAVLLVSAAA